MVSLFSSGIGDYMGTADTVSNLMPVYKTKLRDSSHDVMVIKLTDQC